jgi:hypothetical protein
MKRTLMTVMAVVVAFGMMSTSFGQAAGPRNGQAGQGQAGGQRGGGQGMRMNPEFQKKVEAIHGKVIKELKLNATQTKAVAAAVKKRDDAAKKMREQMMADQKAGKKPNREDMQAKFKKVQDTYKADMTKAMGAANYTKYEKRMKEEMQKLMEEMRKNGQGGKGGAKAGGGKGGGGKAGGGL